MEFFPEVVQVIPHRDYTVDVYFHDGKITRYDMKDKINKGVFAQLKNPDTFIRTCTILNDTLAWDLNGNRDCTTCIDIDPETLYASEEI